MTGQAVELLIYLLVNLLTSQLVKPCKLTISLTCLTVNSLTYQLVNPSICQLINLSTHQLVSSLNIPQLLSLLFQGRKPFP